MDPKETSIIVGWIWKGATFIAGGASAVAWAQFKIRNHDKRLQAVEDKTATLTTKNECELHREALQQKQTKELEHGKEEFAEIKEMIKAANKSSDEKFNMIISHLLDKDKS